MIQVEGLYPPEFEPLVAGLAEVNIKHALDDLLDRLSHQKSPETKKPYLPSALAQLKVKSIVLMPVEGKKTIQVCLCGLPEHPHIRQEAIRSILEMTYTTFGAHTSVQVTDRVTGIILMEKRCFKHAPDKEDAEPAAQEDTPLVDA